MSKFQALIATVIGGLSVAFSGAAAAQAKSNVGPYVGANVSLYNKYLISCEPGVSCDKTAGLGGKVYGGYDFGAYGVEAFAFSVGSAKGSIGAGFLSPGKVREDGVGLVGVLPITSGDVTFKGKLGVAYTRGRASYTGGPSTSYKTYAPVGGVGVSYALSKTLSLNADWDQVRAKYSVNSTRVPVDMLSIGLSTKF